MNVHWFIRLFYRKRYGKYVNLLDTIQDKWLLGINSDEFPVNSFYFVGLLGHITKYIQFNKRFRYKIYYSCLNIEHIVCLFIYLLSSYSL